ncbi:hypothetical protein CL3_09690 [butyrate-producing bacterium SM4/1]|nr:hypothetical protein CL3_09690 [butyrate-producing bacterium SM4/1]
MKRKAAEAVRKQAVAICLKEGCLICEFICMN